MQLHKYTSAQQQAQAISEQLKHLIEQLLTTQSQVTLALSGGKSPIAIFTQLSHYNLAWDRINLTLVDERFIPTSHEDSNEKLVRQHLLINQAQVANFVGLVTSDNILQSVNNANLQIKHIDIAILGMGEDGHTASIFPCCPELNSAINLELMPEKYIITTPTSAKYQRIGLSLAGILEIKHLLISINGDAKLSILQQASSQLSIVYPISQVLTRRPDCQVFWYN
jgi:6-phosphogluconolactonase